MLNEEFIGNYWIGDLVFEKLEELRGFDPDKYVTLRDRYCALGALDCSGHIIITGNYETLWEIYRELGNIHTDDYEDW